MFIKWILSTVRQFLLIGSNPLALFLISTLLFSCQQNEDLSSAPSSNESKESLKLVKLLGKSLTCQTKNGPAFVLFFSPHIIGIFNAKDKGRSIQYFKSDFINKDKELFYQELMIGRVDLKTEMANLDSTTSRRIRLKIDKEKVLILVANGIDAKTKIPLKPMQFECVLGEAIPYLFLPGSQPPPAIQP